MWLSNFEIVLKDRVIERGAVRIEGGLIADIRETPIADADVEGGGRLLLPGFVDMHGDMIEKEVEPRANARMPLELGIYDLDKKLASCGVTTAYAALAFTPATYGHVRSVEQTSAMIEALAAMHAELLIDHRVHARFEVTFPSALTVAEKLMDTGALRLISLMDHTPGQGQYRDIEIHVANTAKAYKIETARAAELVKQRIADRAAHGDAMHIVTGLAELASTRGIAIASHDDDTVEKVALMHSLGAAISEFPINLGAAKEAKRLGLAIAMGAPNAVRGLSYSGNLSAREAYAAGVLDILASDYHPSAILPAVIALGDIGEGGLASSVALASRNPANALGLDDRGQIAEGLRADLVIAERGRMPRLRAALRGGRLVWSDGTLTVGEKSVGTHPAQGSAGGSLNEAGRTIQPHRNMADREVPYRPVPVRQ
ncbi:alpha-D-ribose 1-methylphosphonate 5-triphosphate diphosphatase [Microvirga sp. VF16]|uniref:alpha-D-ribose 1-methylphosphonate 5-triphosphate diphosphatase n=1 Tax=Microvirga sp. VF16 TaxID=2807101 RepID=UPI00193DB14C|nr:alpha-D-ribose 1-methylphosphonate 5-triphosphate diphosphatase [Microvirga sp. VF16]QRM32803.1 alpha-D-ribose 1-methylphosphonate 5-triphosphate diphosphatase [Microvirga sp. VF16]